MVEEQPADNIHMVEEQPFKTYMGISRFVLKNGVLDASGGHDPAVGPPLGLQAVKHA